MTGNIKWERYVLTITVISLHGTVNSILLLIVVADDTESCEYTLIDDWLDK